MVAPFSDRFFRFEAASSRKKAIPRLFSFPFFFFFFSSNDPVPFSLSERCVREERRIEEKRTYGPPTLAFPNDCVTRVYKLSMHFRPTLCHALCSLLRRVTVTCARSHVSDTLLHISLVDHSLFSPFFPSMEREQLLREECREWDYPRCDFDPTSFYLGPLPYFSSAPQLFPLEMRY